MRPTKQPRPTTTNPATRYLFWAKLKPKRPLMQR